MTQNNKPQIANIPVTTLKVFFIFCNYAKSKGWKIEKCFANKDNPIFAEMEDFCVQQEKGLGFLDMQILGVKVFESWLIQNDCVMFIFE